MEQKFLVTLSQTEVQSFLNDGWKIVSVTAQHVSSGTSSLTFGKFAIILERPINQARTYND